MEKTHSFGNPNSEEWFLKLADRESSKIQRLEINSIFPNKKLSNSFIKALARFIKKHGVDPDKLREFIIRSKSLASIKSSSIDINRVSLKDHLLLTDKILQIILKLRLDHPFGKDIRDWFKTEAIQEMFNHEISKLNIKKDIKIKPCTEKVLFDIKIVRHWNTEKIALEFGILISEAEKIKLSGRFAESE